MKEIILNVLKKMRTDYGNNEMIIFAQDSDLQVVADELEVAINYTRCSTHLKGGKYTQAFIDYVEKYFIHRPKVYDWVSKDGKREYTHKQLCAYYEKAMLESPLIV